MIVVTTPIEQVTLTLSFRANISADTSAMFQQDTLSKKPSINGEVNIDPDTIGRANFIAAVNDKLSNIRPALEFEIDYPYTDEQLARSISDAFKTKTAAIISAERQRRDIVSTTRTLIEFVNNTLRPYVSEKLMAGLSSIADEDIEEEGELMSASVLSEAKERYDKLEGLHKEIELWIRKSIVDAGHGALLQYALGDRSFDSMRHFVVGTDGQFRFLFPTGGIGALELFRNEAELFDDESCQVLKKKEIFIKSLYGIGKTRQREECEQAENEEMTNWVNLHGSAHLKDGIYAGYDMTRRYRAERIDAAVCELYKAVGADISKPVESKHYKIDWTDDGPITRKAGPSQRYLAFGAAAKKTFPGHDDDMVIIFEKQPDEDDYDASAFVGQTESLLIDSLFLNAPDVYVFAP